MPISSAAGGRESAIVASDLARMVAASDRRPRVTVYSPFDRSLVGELPRSSPDDVREAFRSAAAAQRAWAARPARERAAIVERFAGLLLAHRDEALDWIQRESGKNRAGALEEFADTVLWAHYVARRGPRTLRERRRHGAFPVLTRTVERRVPKGVVGVITPWNYPLTLPVSDSLPALVAGNAVVLKPDSLTPHTAAFALALLREAGLPEGVMRLVAGAGSELGEPLVECADFVMFTGSTATGRLLAEQCARRLIGFSAELGGKNPLLVLEDADVPRAAAGAVHAAFSNAGQLCVSVERIYVHRNVWDAFVPEFVRCVERMRLAAGATWDADMGSLIDERQLEAVSAHVEDARAKGATVLTGGRTRPDLGPCFYEPTVLTGVVPGMDLHDEETFGPVVSLYRVDSDDDAVRAANRSEYGLNASVWSRRRGTEIARRLRTGTVNVHEGYAAAWASYGAPMGGMKLSGQGRRHGAEGILKYTEAQTVAAQSLVPIAGPPALSHEQWATLLTFGIRILRRIR